MATKICSTCQETKELDGFPKHGRTCKVCSANWQKEHRRKQREAYLQLHPPQPRTIPSHKTCTMCGQTFPIENFNFCNAKRNVRAPYCRPCHGKRSYADKLRRGNPERENLKYRCNQFGTTTEWYDATFAKQDGKCALCHQPETHPVVKGGTVRRLAIDHDHEGKHVRGLLCFRCNTALRQVEKHGDGWAERAVEYLKQYKA